MLCPSSHPAIIIITWTVSRHINRNENPRTVPEIQIKSTIGNVHVGYKENDTVKLHLRMTIIPTNMCPSHLVSFYHVGLLPVSAQKWSSACCFLSSSGSGRSLGKEGRAVAGEDKQQQGAPDT